MSYGNEVLVQQLESFSQIGGILLDVEYAMFDQQRTSKMPAKSSAGISEESLDQFVNKLADATVERMKLTVKS